jgi:chorismate synthase
MLHFLEEVRDSGDTAGGVISVVVKDVPPGTGDPVMDKLSADLARAMFIINAVKGFEIGSGFRGSRMRGSEHNDPFVASSGGIKTLTNHSGGIQGGIANGMDIRFQVAFKPVSTLAMAQDTVDHEGKPVRFEGKGRHDVCVVPRAVPIVEAMTALVIADHYLRQRQVPAG